MKQTTTLLKSTKKKNAAIFHEQLLNFFLLVTTKKIILFFVTALLFFLCPSFISAQSCNQVEILYQAPECLEDKHQGSAGLGGSSCKEIAVCVNQPYTYSSSVSGTGWTFNWTVTGPTAVVINPNSTSAVVNIVWPQVGVYTLTLTATDVGGNVFTYCLKVNVKDKPVANFTFTPNNVCAGSTISFTNTTTYSGGSVGYSWDFGDIPSGANNYSTSTNPFHTFNAAGVYTVTLVAYSTASSGTGGQPDHPRIVACCADTITMQVTIIAGSLTIECISTVCSGDTATYTAVGCANPIWLPPVGGTFLNPPTGNTVTIIWGNGNPQGQILAQCPGGCIASVSVPIIPANPIIAGNASPCPNSTTSYSLPELPGTFYNWILNNISNATNYNNLLNTYPDNNTVTINWALAPPGTYHLIINLNNKHICCNSSGLLIINPTQAWKAFSDQTVCTGLPGASLFVLPAAGTYTWNVLAPNGGVSPLTGTGPTFNPVFSNTGNYTIEVTETGNNYCNSGIANPQHIQVTVVGTPAPGIINGPATVCLFSDNSYSMSTNAPTGYHYEWSISTGAGSFQPGNLTTTTGNSATIQWTALSGTISVVLQRNGAPPCPNPVTLNVVQATVGSISGPDSVCVDGTGAYTLTGGNLPAGEIITWSLAAPFSSIGTIISGQGTNSIIILWHGQPGVGPWGPVTIKASTGCGNATPLTGVMIFPKFMFTITKTGTDICQPGGVTLTVTGAPSGSSYLWNTGATTSSIANLNTAGTYDVTVTKGGCSFNKQYLVPDPFEIAPVTCGVGICTVNDSTNQLLGVTIIKPLVGTFTYQWYKDTFPTGTLIPGATTPNYTTPTHGKFYVIVTYGSCSKRLAFVVSKVCCPDVNNPQITSVVRNTCNSYTFTGTTPNPFGAPITWYWGDGTQDSGVSGVAITHVYALAGQYCVTFCVGPPSSNPTNCSGNCVATNVTVPIDAAFSYTLGCNGCLSVSNVSTVITSNPAFVTYFWNFGDGDTSVSQNPGIHCYALPGTYVVSLTLTYNDGVVTCTKTATHTITYTPLGIIVVPTPVCSGTASTYSSTPGSYVSYTWDFGDGFTAYTPSSTHIYNLPGAYLVTLTVIDQLGNTCTDTTTINVLPGIGPCTIQPAFICPGCTDTLSTPNIAGYTYLWEVESSPNVFIPAPGVNTNNTYIVTTPGFYRVIITGVNGCNCITKKVEVKAVPSPKAIISVAPSSAICGSGNITLTSINHLTGHTSDWYANGNYGNLLSSGPMHFEFNVTSSTVYNLVLTNEYGCTDTCSFTVIVNPIPVPPMITSSPTLCEGVPISLTVTNYPTNITWNSGFIGTSIIVTLAGTYSATYTDSITGCSSSSNITINRRPPVGLFPHYCDSIPCTCRNLQGDFTIYAPKPLIGAFAAIYDIQWYFNNNPVGPNGPNPFFTPAVTGTYHIVVTDPITGCTDTSKTYSIIVPLCNQCDSTTCHVDLGNDTTICAGDVLTITALGCTGITKLFELGPNGPIPLGPGPIWDVYPTQNTCYVVECCDSIPDQINGGYILCCCTDTICITVNPLPTLTWSVTYPNACLNSDSIYLDTLNITATPTGGTGVFSGPNVVGNYFYPNSLGTFTITYCYTDTNGCTTCVFNTITVIFCCDSTSCHVDLGNDTAICAGGVFTLTASGCTGTVTWYQLGGPGGPVVIGQGPIIDVMPQQTTCYVVECCQTFYDENGGTNVCCCTDTICITVNPLPTLTWSVTYPNACLNSDSIYLDTLNITATPTGGTGVFTGPNVVGYYFYPNTLGPNTITYCYTDTNGCTACVTNIINVVYCCDSSNCHVDAGPDQIFCSNEPIIALLESQGCSSVPDWYKITSTGNIFLNHGYFYQAGPETACYMVVCCCEPMPGVFCCDTDTVCIYVYPPPVLTWQTVYPNVCLNSAPIYLDTLSITATPAGGTGVFTGPNVVGYYFYPNTLGPNTITYCYTDTNGCTACVTNIINVVYCCDTSCHVDLGPDQTICAGGVAILNSQGCTGNTVWYKLGATGPVAIGQGPIIDVTPQQNTCYIAICCCPDPIGTGALCCDTDTVCIVVNPNPILQWQLPYTSICQSADSIYLDPSTVLVSTNNGFVPITTVSGTWAWSGIGVNGNYFYPNTLGPHTITICFTDSFGCTACLSNTINVISCCDSLCHVDAGADTTICFGDSIKLTALGCNGMLSWVQINGEGNIVLANENNIFVHPQTTTCYMAICCCIDSMNTGVLCCDTDTVCITVLPEFILNGDYGTSSLISFAACVGDTFTVDLFDVFVDTSNFAGTFNPSNLVFSGPSIIGGSFTGSTNGLFYSDSVVTDTIIICYTNELGCIDCDTLYLDWVHCCDSSICHVDAGPDQSICIGGVAILTAQGCDTIPKWYEITAEGPVPIGQGGIVDVMPQQTTCYMVICCCAGYTTIACCDTDTVCVIVNPLPTVIWKVMYPNACLNSDSIYLDTLNISASPAGGTGVFSGTGVVGYYFYPNTLGASTITYCYTDTNGCTACVSNTINVVECCDTTCHVDAGPDQSICIGGVAILTAQNCDSTPQWYELTAEGPVPIGQGGIIDVMPQQTTCYMVICCCAGYTTIACCDTDTVCVIVNPLPHLDWPLSYAPICLNGAPVYLDPNNIFVTINNNQVPLPSAGGTWSFTGTGVLGSNFYPTTLGTHTITLCYTDANGCTACVTNTISVIECCNDTCQITASNDITICAYTITTLSVDGCDSIPYWYVINGQEWIEIGQGEILDVLPLQTTCYGVICCCPNTACCDTDTVCVTVIQPLHLDWPLSYAPVCFNDPAVYLDPNNIFVNVNNTMVALPFTGGTWYFSGTGVFGSSFYPTTVGTHLITLYYTDPNGCTRSVSNTITVNRCGCDPICEDFNDGMLTGWQADPNAPNVFVTITNFGSQGGGGDYYIQTTDDAGASALMADTVFNEWCCGEFCYDYRIFNDGDPNNTLNVPPIFWIYSGTLGFSFTSNIIANENNGWHRVCAPVSTCELPPDSGAAGEWNPIPGTSMIDWSTVTSNITRIVFRVDYSPFQNEVTGFDNVCFYPTYLAVSLAAVCDKICADVDRCCDTLTYQWSGGTVVGGNCITGLIPNSPYTVTVYNQDGDSATATIMSGPPVDDGNPCTEDYCDPVTGVITHTHIIFSDGDACTEEYCDPQTGVIVVTNISCDDGNACTIDACDPIIGCYYASISPDDFNACTEDGCDPASGVYHIPISCDDNNMCTIDACDPATGCYYASINPDDGNPCTIDGCDPVSGVYHIPATEICGNGIDDDCDGLVDEGCISNPVLNVSVYIEGFYTGSGVMQPVLLNAGVGTDTSVTDTILIVLHADTVPFDVDTAVAAILNVNGSSTITLSANHAGKSYYIAVVTRNGIEIWSKLPVTLGAVTDYDFRISDISGPGGQNQLRINSINKNPFNRRSKIIKP